MNIDKLAIITDTHHGIRNSSKIFREMMFKWYEEVFFPRLKVDGIKEIIHLGDFFDSRTSLTLHDLDATINRFLPLLDQYKVNMTVIAGNHDVAYRNTNRVNSLSVLKQHPRVTLVQDNIEIITTKSKYFVLCPWLNEENQEELLEELKYYANDDYILGMHGEFKDMKMYKNSKVCEHGLDVEQFKKFHKVVSGHFHHPSVYGNVEYLGAAFHFNWQDHNDWRGFHIYDSESNTWKAVENTYCLFTEFEYTDQLQVNDSDLAEQTKGRIVRVTINEEYDKVQLKDFVNRIEQNQPVSVDVADNTILESHMLSGDDSDVSEQKDISEYVDEALEEHSRKDELKDLFNTIRESASSKMIEIE